MKSKRLKRNFYTRPTLLVAKELLGKYLARKIGKKKIIGKITETEAYIGPQDKASHAYLPRRNFRAPSKEIIKKIFGNKLFQDSIFLENFLRGGGKITPRNKTEYLEGGHIYIYLCYGIYWQLNFTTAKNGEPECVLIRALEPVIANKHEFATNIMNKNSRKLALEFVKIRDLANGPGKLCRWLKLDKSFDGEDLTKSKRIWLEGGGKKLKKSHIVATTRIGIDYAEEWAKKPWRFYIKGNTFVSRKQNIR